MILAELNNETSRLARFFLLAGLRMKKHRLDVLTEHRIAGFLSTPARMYQAAESTRHDLMVIVFKLHPLVYHHATHVVAIRYQAIFVERQLAFLGVFAHHYIHRFANSTFFFLLTTRSAVRKKLLGNGTLLKRTLFPRLTLGGVL